MVLCPTQQGIGEATSGWFRPIDDIRPSATYEYRDDELAGFQIQEDVYYIPSKRMK
jgi:hypothetical protein